MKITVNYTDGVLNLPRSVIKSIKSATREDMAALIAVMSEPRAAEDLTSCADAIAETAGITRTALDASLAFWRGAGVISIDGVLETAADQVTTAEKNKKPAPARITPELTGEEAEAIIASSPERRSLLNECQQTMGHMFNNTESAIVLGLCEYYGLEDEYILLLMAYCVRRGKKSVKYVEKMAHSMFERDIDTSEALESYLTWREESLSTEGQLRRLLGMGTRSFTKKERDMFERWSRTFGYDFDMMEAAYNATVNAIGKPSMPYMSKVLESWHEQGYKTPDEAVAAGKNRQKTEVSGSFDTDEAFRLAVMRSMSGDNAEGT